MLRSKPRRRSSEIKCMRPMTSRREEDRAMYSASVVERAMRVCILEDQITGHPAYMIK